MAIDCLIWDYSSIQQPRAALVCAEAVWWKCHRSMIADVLAFRDQPCYHLPTKPPVRSTSKRYVKHTEVVGNRLARYEPDIVQTWYAWIAGRGLTPERQGA